MATLKQKYTEEVMPALKEALGLPNPMMIPKVSKVVVNMGLGCADKDTLKVATEQLAAVTGQRPVVRKAKKSISNFKLREGMAIGTKVTLRRQQMYDFLDRLINISLPRIRDFRGIPTTGFDGRGNYTLGVREQTLFPEIDPNDVNKTLGMDITIVTTAKTDAEARELLTRLGMPFAKKA
jgi:large subunit ribosomal protein L5